MRKKPLRKLGSYVLSVSAAGYLVQGCKANEDPFAKDEHLFMGLDAR
jgi:hypothetical protein